MSDVTVCTSPVVLLRDLSALCIEFSAPDKPLHPALGFFIRIIQVIGGLDTLSTPNACIIKTSNLDFQKFILTESPNQKWGSMCIS